MFSNKKSAFTIMEVMIAVFIIGILATLAGPRIMDMLRQVKVSQTKAKLAALQGGLEQYQMDVGKLPPTLNALLEVPPNLPPTQRNKWRGPYVKGENVLADAWGGEFEYHAPPARYKKEFRYYEIYSFGIDGEESDDDIKGGE